jgi:hypothetical protein
MKITPWKKYQYIFFGGGIVAVLLCAILLNFGYTTLSLVASVLCIIIKIIWEGKIVCPECHTPLNTSIKSNSKYFQGYSPFVPEKCVNCGAELNELNKEESCECNQ